ncbi:MAG: arylsulfatase, partial [Gemmatimonadetes bacterium]|nr:arylsulfatase [Gemmatimonadota bacterium]
KWKLLLHQSSGGNDYPDDSPDDAPGQLYDMETGYRELENLYAQHPEVVSRLTDLINQYKMKGRSVPLEKA